MRQAAWLSDAALRGSAFVAPVRDDLVGGHVAIASSPIPGGKGVVAAFADLGALGPHLARSTAAAARPSSSFTTGDHRTVVARSTRPSRWIGTRLLPASQSEARIRVDAIWTASARLYAHASAPKAGWNIYVGEDKASVLASVTRSERASWS